MSSSIPAIANEIFPLIGENSRFHPLGGKIRNLEYRFSRRFPDIKTIRDHCAKVRAQITAGDLTEGKRLFQDMGFSTATMESFFSLSKPIWRELKQTALLVAGKILTAEGEQKASDFLRPLAYLGISEEPGFVWGYLTPGTGLRHPLELPPRCAWSAGEGAEGILKKLHDDLIESLERRDDPKIWVPSKNQCNEPQHPVRYRIRPEIDGGDSLGENSSTILSPEKSVSQLEFGTDYKLRKDLPADYAWNIDSYTCEQAPTLTEIEGEKVVLQAPPSVLRDCSAMVRLTMTGPFGVPRIATKSVAILNTVNDPPVVIQEPPKVPAKRTARKKPETPPLPSNYSVGGLQIQDLGKGGNPPAPGRVSVTLPRRPKLLEPRPAAVDPKRSGLTRIAEAGGLKPKIVLPPELIDAIVESVVPEQIVDDIDVMIMIDRSGSMGDDVQLIRSQVPRIVEAMIQKVKDKNSARVRISITSYVDDHYIPHLHLSPVRKKVIDKKLEEVIKGIKMEGWKETIWDALYLAITQEAWNKNENVLRRIIYLTDEGGDTGKLGKTEDDVSRASVQEHVSVQPIFILDNRWLVEFLEREQAYLHALTIQNEEERIKYIVEKFIPMCEASFNIWFGQPVKGVQTSNSGEIMRDQLLHLFQTVRDPQKRFEIAKEKLYPSTKEKSLGGTYGSTYFRPIAKVVYQRLILGIPDLSLQEKVGEEWLKERWDIPDEVAVIVSTFDFVFNFAIAFDEEKRLAFMEKYYLSLLKHHAYVHEYDPVIIDQISRVLEMTPNMEKRKAWLKKNFLDSWLRHSDIGKKVYLRTVGPLPKNW